MPVVADRSSTISVMHLRQSDHGTGARRWPADEGVPRGRPAMMRS